MLNAEASTVTRLYFGLTLFTFAFIPMLLEARLASRNERRLREAGAIEPKDDVFRAMRVVYPLSFAAMIAEAWLRGAEAGATFTAGLALFVVAKALKYWAIATLGTRWTFRVLVPPGAPLIERGPYRFLRHPNYVAVIGEFAGMALMCKAPVAGGAAIVVFIRILVARIRSEERALGLRR